MRSVHVRIYTRTSHVVGLLHRNNVIISAIFSILNHVLCSIICITFYVSLFDDHYSSIAVSSNFHRHICMMPFIFCFLIYLETRFVCLACTSFDLWLEGVYMVQVLVVLLTDIGFVRNSFDVCPQWAYSILFVDSSFIVEFVPVICWLV